MNRTIKEMLASMPIVAKISMRFWHYGLKHACVLWNTGRMFEGISLEERVHKRRIEYSKIQAFGAECWIRLPPEKRPKADLTVPKAWKQRLLSINYPGTGYIVLLDGEPEKAVVSRDVVFKRVLEDQPIGSALGTLPLVPRTLLRRDRRYLFPSSISAMMRMPLQKGMWNKLRFLYLLYLKCRDLPASLSCNLKFQREILWDSSCKIKELDM
jgi:hypothetical protein